MRRRIGLVLATAVAVGFAAVLVVVAVPALRGSDVPACAGAARIELACHVDRYDRLARQAGPRAALADLAAARDDNGYVRIACHQLAHVIGRAAGEELTVTEAYADGSTDGGVLCSAGYEHGVVESAMATIGAADIARRAAEVCAGPRDQDRGGPAHYYCVHGMGHGFMGLYASDVHAALAGCDLLGPWEAGHCAGGVFMENLTAVHNPGRPSRFVRAGDPLYPCAEVAPRFRGECYDKQTSYAMYVAGDDVAQVFALCAAVDAADRTACDRGLGGKVAILANKYLTGLPEVAAATRDMCLRAQETAHDAARADCVTGAVTAHIRDYGGSAQADALCAALDGPNPDSPNPDSPNPDSPNPDSPNPDSAAPDGVGDLRATCETARRDALATWQPPPSGSPGAGHH